MIRVSLNYRAWLLFHGGDTGSTPSVSLTVRYSFELMYALTRRRRTASARKRG